MDRVPFRVMAAGPRAAALFTRALGPAARAVAADPPAVVVVLRAATPGSRP